MSPFKRVVTIISGLAFLGFMGSQIHGMVAEGMRTSQQQEQQARQANQQQLEQLQMQENGYEMVLEREPNNENALEGLVQIRLNMKDYKGAIQPLEKLVDLNPEQGNYKQLLAQLQQQINYTENTSTSDNE
jgi:predicted Zn-dependent protease